MNSAVKPGVGSAGVPQGSGQASPAKANVASGNHAPVGLPQGAQNSVPHANSLNLSAPSGGGPQQHAAPSMAPVSANMAQMAHNMSHHGNLSQHQPAEPGKPVPGAPLALVQDKPAAAPAAPSQPLALTHTPDKKEVDSTPSQSNGTIDSPKSGSHAPSMLKPQNPEVNKDKQDIAKTSPSTPKPPEKPSTPTTQKAESTNSVSQVDGPSQPKVATANEPPEKSPSKPSEPKQAPTADVAPTQSDTKPVPEAAKDTSTSQPAKPTQPSAPQPPKPEAPKDPEPSKPEIKPVKAEEKSESSTEKSESSTADKDSKEKVEPKKETPEKSEEKVKELNKDKDQKEEKKDIKPVEKDTKDAKKEKQKSTMKLATVTPPMRKRRQASPAKEGPSSAKKQAEDTPSSDTRSKRNRTKVQLYQSPTPEIAMATKLSASAGRSTPTKPQDDKLIVFYKNEYLAVRNAEGGFYVCQAMQNVYRTTRKIKIRWLSQDKTIDPSGETYKPDFYDVTDMECVLTTLSLSRASGGGGAQVLAAAERARATSILQRALRVEQGRASPDLNPEHPDGLDLSLYTDESQLEKKSRKRNSSKSSPRAKQDSANETAKETATPAKKARTTPKRSPKTARKSKTPAKTQNNNKRKSLGSNAVVATSKTATAVTEKAKEIAKDSPKTPTRTAKSKDKPETPARKGRRSAAKVEAKPSPSTSGAASGRTRKPPQRK